jgi:hypothetical protein
VRAHTEKKLLRYAVGLPTLSGARGRAAPAEGASCAPSPDEQKERPRAALCRARLWPLADTPIASPLPLLPPKAFPRTLFALHALPGCTCQDPTGVRGISVSTNRCFWKKRNLCVHGKPDCLVASAEVAVERMAERPADAQSLRIDAVREVRL